MVIGNKCDLELKKEVASVEVQEFCDDNGYLFIETSALSSENVAKAFSMLATKVAKN